MNEGPIISDCFLMMLVSLWMLAAGYAPGLLHAARFLEMQSRKANRK